MPATIEVTGTFPAYQVTVRGTLLEILDATVDPERIGPRRPVGIASDTGAHLIYLDGDQWAGHLGIVAAPEALPSGRLSVGATYDDSLGNRRRWDGTAWRALGGLSSPDGSTLVADKPIVAPNLQRISLDTGARALILGDSIAANGGNELSKGGPMMAAALQSAWRLRIVKNAGVSGWKVSDVLADAAQHLAAYTPDITFIHVGSNDALGSTDLSAYDRDYSALIDLVRSYGSIPVCIQLPPYTAKAAAAALIARRQQVICMKKGALLSRRYGAINDGTFAMQAAAGDGLHPYSDYHWTEGTALLAELDAANLLPATANIQSESNTDSDCPFTNVFFKNSSGGVASGVSAVSGGSLSIAAASDGVGNAQVITYSGNTTGQIGARVTFGNVAGGKTYLVRMKLVVTCSSGLLRVGSFRSGASGIEPMQLSNYGIRVPAGRTATFWLATEATPTSSNDMSTAIYDEKNNAHESGTGTIAIERAQLHCLTDLGVA